jgi:hypothetical protein
MKRDVTRQGKRTKRGIVDDMLSFTRRYISNNYHDAEYQNGLNLILRNSLDYQVFEKSYFYDSKNKKIEFQENSGKIKVEMNFHPSKLFTSIVKKERKREQERKSKKQLKSGRKKGGKATSSSLSESMLFGASALIIALFLK